MNVQKLSIEGIPAFLWGDPSDRVYLCVHGKMSSKEAAGGIASLAAERGYQTLAFDLPQHGERTNQPDRCDIWNGIRDLSIVGEYVFDRWKEVSLYACSLGAFFSLHAYGDRRFENCLFQSPIVDMEYLVRQMMLWFDISEERLAREKEIDTPVDLLSWDYFQYVLAHPIRRWNAPTNILFGGKDNLQSLDVMRTFARRFGCNTTLSQNSEHPFMLPEDIPIVEKWLRENL